MNIRSERTLIHLFTSNPLLSKYKWARNSYKSKNRAFRCYLLFTTECKIKHQIFQTKLLKKSAQTGLHIFRFPWLTTLTFSSQNEGLCQIWWTSVNKFNKIAIVNNNHIAANLHHRLRFPLNMVNCSFCIISGLDISRANFHKGNLVVNEACLR